MDRAYQEALKKINKAKRKRAKELDLGMMDLQEVPPEIGNLAKLKDLSLYHNQLTRLPQEIVKLTNLTGLSLSNNQLTKFG